MLNITKGDGPSPVMDEHSVCISPPDAFSPLSA
jgi:hypothetical protein